MPPDFGKYFTTDQADFDSPDEPGSRSNMSSFFLEMLNHARGLSEIPFSINSGYRTPEHNRSVGGVSNSSHTRGWAADISCVGSARRAKMIIAMVILSLYSGLKRLRAPVIRIGIAKTYLHWDLDPTQPSPRIWLY